MNRPKGFPTRVSASSSIVLPSVHRISDTRRFDDNATLYGKKLENRDIVTKGVPPPKAAAKLLELLNRYSARERTE